MITVGQEYLRVSDDTIFKVTDVKKRIKNKTQVEVKYRKSQFKDIATYLEEHIERDINLGHLVLQ